jgi:hypothetical protein
MISAISSHRRQGQALCARHGRPILRALLSSAGRAQQRPVERRMQRRDVRAVGHRNAVEFYPGMRQRPGAQAGACTDPDDRSLTTQ